MEHLRGCYEHIIEVFTHCLSNTSEICSSAGDRLHQKTQSFTKYNPFALMFKDVVKQTEYEPVDEENPFHNHNRISSFQYTNNNINNNNISNDASIRAVIQSDTNLTEDESHGQKHNNINYSYGKAEKNVKKN